MKADPMAGRDDAFDEPAPVIPVGSEARSEPTPDARALPFEGDDTIGVWVALCPKYGWDHAAVYNDPMMHVNCPHCWRFFGKERPCEIRRYERQGTGHERVIPATDLRAKLDAMNLGPAYRGAGADAYREGYKAAWRAISAWLDEYTTEAPLP